MKKHAILLSSLLLAPVVVPAQEGEWLVAPYIWASDVSWDLAQSGGGSVAFGDVVDKIDGAALIRIEYARNKVGFTFDYIDLGLSDSRRITTPGPLPVDITVRTGVDQRLVEAGMFYRVSTSDRGIDVIAGIRDTNVDSSLVVAPASQPAQRFDTSDSFTDVIIGARYLHRLNKSWDFAIRGDYGFGGSDGAVNLMAQLGWRSRGTFGMSLAYRHITFDFDQRIEGESATSEFTFSGPALGFMFRF